MLPVVMTCPDKFMYAEIKPYILFLLSGIIERLSPGTRKIELFGRPHNIQPNWMTLGNQLDGVRLNDQDIIEDFRRRYPDGNCMHKPPPSQGQSTTY